MQGEGEGGGNAMLGGLNLILTSKIQKLNPPLSTLTRLFCPWQRLSKGVRGT